MQIFVKTLTGRKQGFDFEPSSTIVMIKEVRDASVLSRQDDTRRVRPQALQEKEGIDVRQIRLIHSGKQLCVFALLLHLRTPLLHSDC